MLISLIRSGFDITTVLVYVLDIAFIVFVVNPIHEFAHAYSAYKMGDGTAKACGRLTLNPLASLDLFGALSMLLFGIGWAKPVPINPNNFKKPKKGMAISALWGPLTNLIVATVIMLVANAVLKFSTPSEVSQLIVLAFYLMANINVMLAVFNFLPIPPLDGSRILAGILPDSFSNWMYKYERYVQIALFVGIFVLSRPLSGLANLVTEGLAWLTALPFNLF